MDKKLQRAKVINYSVAVIFLLIFISIVVISGVFKWSRTFTVRKWTENPDGRYKIVSDMLAKNNIVGMTEEEIINLLGKETENAPESFKFPDGNFSNESNLTYGLGVFYIDYEWLIITMENGVAIRCTIGAN